MTNVVAFEASSVPAFLRNRKGPNSDLTSHVGTGGYPVLSIKGKVFAVCKGDDRNVVQRENDDGEKEPARNLEVILLKANPHLSKNYYKAEFEEGVNANPDCSSSNGIAPDPGTENPQSASCAVCKHNVWGTGRGGKGKACQDHRRVAVCAPDQINEPMLLRVPPASLKPLAEHAASLDNRDVDYFSIVTVLKFEAEAATPQLIFTVRKRSPFVTEEQYAEIEKQRESDLVKQIIGETPPQVRKKDEAPAKVEEKPAKKAKPADDEDEAPAPKKAKPKAEEKAKPAPADDEDEAPAPKKAAKAKVVEEDEDLDALLDELDS